MSRTDQSWRECERRQSGRGGSTARRPQDNAYGQMEHSYPASFCDLDEGMGLDIPGNRQKKCRLTG
jgi:hypothetical protein